MSNRLILAAVLAVSLSGCNAKTVVVGFACVAFSFLIWKFRSSAERGSEVGTFVGGGSQADVPAIVTLMILVPFCMGPYLIYSGCQGESLEVATGASTSGQSLGSPRSSDAVAAPREEPVVVATPDSHCGDPDHDPGEENWTNYECQSRADAPSPERCLGRTSYTDQFGMGCPGSELCCPRE